MFCLLLIASFNSSHLSPKANNLIGVLWIFLIGWVLFIHKDPPVKKKKRRIYFEDDED